MESQKSEEPYDELRQQWIELQTKVASQVVVIPDNDDVDNDNDQGDCYCRCSCSRQHHHQQYDGMEVTTQQPLNHRRYCCCRHDFVRLDNIFGWLHDDPQQQQKQYPSRITDHPLSNKYFVGGVDVSFPPPITNASVIIESNDAEQSSLGMAVAVYVIMDVRTFHIVYQDHVFFELTVPYIPGFLAFRERDAMVSLVQRQFHSSPDFTPRAILVDGNGIWHPRGAGLACFVGVECQIATVGVGKTFFSQNGMTKDLVWQRMFQALQSAVLEHNTQEQEKARIHHPKDASEERHTSFHLPNSDGRSLWWDRHPICATTSNHEIDDNDDQQRCQGRDNSAIKNTNSGRSHHHQHHDDDDEEEFDNAIQHEVPDNVVIDPGVYLQQLAPYCLGLAIPMHAAMDMPSSSSSLLLADPCAVTTTTTTTEHVAASPLQRTTTTRTLTCALLVGHGGGRRLAIGASKPKNKIRSNCLIVDPQMASNTAIGTVFSSTAATTTTTTTTTTARSCSNKAGTKKPVFISVGHAISLREAAQLCATVSLVRIPEPVRQADLRGRALLRERWQTSKPQKII